MPNPEKTELRLQLRDLRRSLSDEHRQTAAGAIAQLSQALPLWTASTKVGLYMHADAEIPTDQLAVQCRLQGKTLYLPVMQADSTLAFHLWSESAELQCNRFGIPEPGKEQPPLDITALDILFMPLVAWDRAGHRLGMGGGFYDRSLQDHSSTGSGPQKVGLAFSIQEVSALPVEAWDIKLDYVLTEQELIAT
jgi:5-formyltetrahydrofolate cyclo-ligase